MAEVPVSPTNKSHTGRWIAVVLGIACVAALGAGALVWGKLGSPIHEGEGTVLFTVEKGQGLDQISTALQEAGFDVSPFLLKMYAAMDGSSSSFFAGTFEIPRSSSTIDIVELLTSGEVSNEQVITIVEGLTIRQIGAYLEDEGILDADEFIATAQNADVTQLYPSSTYTALADKPASASLEGYLFPDTYRVYTESSATQIIQKLLDNFEAQVTAEIRSGFTEQGLTTYEAVTLASIVEREVRTTADRKIAAGIFLSRLRLGIALQSDATVNYVTGKQALQPSLDDLEADSEYNTYKHRGLPPGPISNPSLASLRAVADPTETDYLYFLSKPDGTTVFSETYEEHLTNKRTYLQ